MRLRNRRNWIALLVFAVAALLAMHALTPAAPADAGKPEAADPRDIREMFARLDKLQNEVKGLRQVVNDRGVIVDAKGVTSTDQNQTGSPGLITRLPLFVGWGQPAVPRPTLGKLQWHEVGALEPDGQPKQWLSPNTQVEFWPLLGLADPHGGFGIIRGANITSPVIWMYENTGSCLDVRVAPVLWQNVPGASGKDLGDTTSVFRVSHTGSIGLGTPGGHPSLFIDPLGNITLVKADGTVVKRNVEKIAP